MFSHINTYLAYGDSTGQVGITDISSGTQHFKSIVAHEGIILSLAYTMCGQLLLSGGNDCKGNEVKLMHEILFVCINVCRHEWLCVYKLMCMCVILFFYCYS